MGVYEDCRHYVQRTMPSGDVFQRCRLSANTEDPFGCPEGCMFKEGRSFLGAGWAQGPTERMSNTADGLHSVPPPKRKKPRKKR